MFRRLTDFAREHWAECAVIALAVVFGLGVFVGTKLAGGTVHTEERQATAAKDEQLHQEHAAAAEEASKSHQVERLVLYGPDGKKKLERTRERELLEHRAAVAAASTDVRTVERVEYRDREVLRLQQPRLSLDLLVGVRPLALDFLAPVRALELGLIGRVHLFGPFWVGAWLQTSPAEPLQQLKLGLSFGGSA